MTLRTALAGAANTDAMFDFAHRLATAQPSDLPQIWANSGKSNWN
jgi:hypothetical protein